MLNDIGHGINGRANREIDYPLGMLARQIPKRGEPIPWKIRKPVSQNTHGTFHSPATEDRRLLGPQSNDAPPPCGDDASSTIFQ
jgi:hypothetical protein